MLNISNNPALEQVFYSSSILLFLIFGAVGVALSIGLIVSKDNVFRIFEAMNGIVSTRKGFRALAIVHDTNQLVVKHKNWFAFFIIVGSAYTLLGIATLAATLDDTKIAASLGLNLPLPFVVWIVQSARLTLIVLSIFSLAIALMLSFSPHALTEIEKPLNKWYSMRKFIYELERMHMGIDKFVTTFPKAVGWVLLFPTLAIMIAFALKLI